MEERYEIRGKIGQGGLGAVYRGYDTRMNREVAIKRISVSGEDPTLLEESTRQLIKEAGALASLQHPHIVTIYDVGSDEDGPYVVMELISGKTLDELIERAPLTWSDFRELALQTQEALIAAQELNLIHSDIKPSNLMLTWLPSGKFQIKIVDFGLATLNQSQSLEEIEEIEAVFGSIFFMAPEQFERVPIDARADMYAMGCVYYQALSGNYPFQGETGNEVMISHLHHTVIPLQELRSDIPVWACDWIMWHINRQKEDRPDSARSALQVFLQNDKNPAPTMSLGRASAAIPAGPRPRLKIPGSSTHQTPRPIIDPRMAPPGYVPPVAPPEEPVVIPEPPLTTTAPQPLTPPEGSKPSIHTELLIADPTPTSAAMPNVGSQSAPPRPTRNFALTPKPKPKVGKSKMVLAAVFGVAIVVLGYFLFVQIQKSKGSRRLVDIYELAAKSGTQEIPMTAAEYAYYLNAFATAESAEKQLSASSVLRLAKSTDSANFDATLVEFATTSAELLPEVRTDLISNVVAKRIGPGMVTPLLDFARSTKDFPSAVAALKAIQNVAGDSEFETLVGIVQFESKEEIRKAAEQTASAIYGRSSQKPKLASVVDKALGISKDASIQEALNRIKGGN